VPAHPVEERPATPAKIELNVQAERARYLNFPSSLGVEMLFIPSGEFTMGSEEPDAAPNERPLTKVSVTRFYLSRYLMTNANYEKFAPPHGRKRMPGAGNRHPVVYVSSG